MSLHSRLPAHIAEKLSLPLLAAPMLHVSGPRLVAEACTAGIIAAFPAINPTLMKDARGLDGWLTDIKHDLEGTEGHHGPICPNLIMRNQDIGEHVAVVIRHGIEIVVTSVGSPKPILPALHDAGVFVLADVATLEHARKAIDAGVDGLVLLTAGAGGQTGWLNPFAFVRAVRGIFDGPIALAGGICDGAALFAAQMLGCDLGYMGTRFIATHESLADSSYREALLASSIDDVVLTRAFTGLPCNFLRSTIVEAGLDPDALEDFISETDAKRLYGTGGAGPRRWTDVRSAGHTVSSVRAHQSVAELVAETHAEYRAAVEASRRHIEWAEAPCI